MALEELGTTVAMEQPGAAVAMGGGGRGRFVV